MTETMKTPVRLPAFVAISGGAALLLGTMTAAPAGAHDTLIGSTPEADAVLEESPEEIVLEFSGEGLTTGESIPNTIWVTDEDGDNWEGEIEVDGPTMRAELPEPLPNGEYEVLYRAVYSDGHSEELDFNFEVDGAPVAEETDAAAAEDATQDEAGTAEDDATEAAEEQTDAAEEPTSGNPTAEEPAADGASGQDEGAEDEAEEAFPVGLVVGIGVGALVLIAVVLLLVRRKLTQAERD